MTACKSVFYIFIFVFLLYSKNSYSQISIGYNAAPVKGAILQLKENSSDNANSLKGLGLPRVKLTDGNNLYPMFQSDGANGYLGATKSVEDESHIGLLVYATDFFCNDINTPFYPSVYVWSGSAWENLFPSSQVPISTFTDGEGNTYTYKQFGSKKWMTQNVRTIYKKGVLANGPIGGSGNAGIVLHHPGSANIGVKVFIETAIPMGHIEYMEKAEDAATPTNFDLTYDEYASKFGLLYNFAQAQNACPEGWSLPTEADWNELITLTGNTASTAGKNFKVDNRSYAPTLSTPLVPWGGYSLCPAGFNLGFDAIPAGMGGDPSEVCGGFGTEAWFWSASGKYVSIYANYDFIDIQLYKQTYYQSVRCVQD